MAINLKELSDLFVGMGVIGAAVFTWGMTRYQAFREARRKEDEADRKATLESVRENARIIAELEAKEAALKQRFEDLLRATNKDQGIKS